MIKRFPEYSRECMKDEYELIASYDKKFGCVECDDDEEKNDSIEIEYIDGENYVPFRNAAKVNDYYFIKNINNYQIDGQRTLSDCFCRLMIYSYGSTSEKLTPANLYEGNKNAKYRLISSGRYKNWKGGFMASGFSECFGIRSKPFAVKGMGELLNYPAICLLIIYEYFMDISYTKDLGEAIKVSVWNVIKRVTDDYDAGIKYRKLSKEERNLICYTVFHRTMYKSKYEYLVDREGLAKVNKTIANLDTKEIYEKMQRQGKQMNEIYNKQQKEKLLSKAQYGNDDRRQIWFSEYLAPIMAAACEFFSEDSFFSQINIWSKENILIKLLPEWLGNDENEKTDDEVIELSKNYCVVKKYIQYKKTMVSLYDYPDFLEKYYYFWDLMLYKIGINNPRTVDAGDEYVQYYVVEQLMNWELIKKETDLICENMKKCGITDIKSFVKSHHGLNRILKKLSKLTGAITRIDLATQVLEGYFRMWGDWERENWSNEKEKKKAKKRWENQTEKVIEKNQLTYDMQERVFLDAVLQCDSRDKNNISSQIIFRNKLRERKSPFMSEEKTESYECQAKEYFKEYFEMANKISSENKVRGINKNIRIFAHQQVEQLDNFEKEIQKWVIRCNFFCKNAIDVRLLD